jgi:2',3'-cyclic-nucleotide 2'-phosphodiesterase (5'-nucleotidase family)
MKIMKAAGFDIMALGNHEFDYGQAILKENISESGLEGKSANVLNQDHTPFLKDDKNNG